MKASVGIAVGQAGTGATELLRQADVAMYRAKSDGKGRVKVFEASMQDEVVERLELEGELQRAIERDEIDVHYQPVIALDGKTLAGFEALARWTHPRARAGPAAALHPAGRGERLDRPARAPDPAHRVPPGRALGAGPPDAARRAADHVGELERAPARGPQHRGRRRCCAGGSGLPAGALVLEITETVLMHDTEATIARLTALKALGVRLAVDDFGTGYSSLRYLRRFPIDILKMAKPFVDGLDTGDDEGRALARAIVELATSLEAGVHRRGHRGGRAGRRPARARLLARPGLPLRPADGAGRDDRADARRAVDADVRAAVDADLVVGLGLVGLEAAAEVLGGLL